MYELKIPIEIQQRGNGLEKRLWEVFDREVLQEECRKVEEWILDPGHSVGRDNLYEKVVVLFWVMKNIVSQDAWDKEATKEANKCMDQWRVVVTTDINQLNIKMDMLLKWLGVLVPPASNLVTLPKPTEEGSRQGGILHLPYIFL